jgi:hypothetical protein
MSEPEIADDLAAAARELQSETDVANTRWNKRSSCASS